MASGGGVGAEEWTGVYLGGGVPSLCWQLAGSTVL